jgi:hypothetical protein
MKAITKVVTSNGNDLSLTSVRNGDAVMMTSSTQNKEIQVNYSTPVNRLTAMRVLWGSTNSHPVGFLL